MNYSLYEQARRLAQRFEQADAGEWQDILSDARHAGWAGPTVSEVQDGQTFTLHKSRLDIRITMSEDEGGIVPVWADVAPI